MVCFYVTDRSFVRSSHPERLLKSRVIVTGPRRISGGVGGANRGDADNAKSRDGAHYREEMARRKRDGKTGTAWRKCATRACTYMYMYTRGRGWRRTPAEGSRAGEGRWDGGSEAQFCSVNPWRRARGVYHSASEFVVPRLVTGRSVFRTQPPRFYPSSPSPLRPSSSAVASFAAIYLRNVRGKRGGCSRVSLRVHSRSPSQKPIPPRDPVGFDPGLVRAYLPRASPSNAYKAKPSSM